MIALAVLLPLLAAPIVRGAMMKPLVCVPIEGARGQPPGEVARMIEEKGAELSHSGYVLAALLPGDVPIACFRSSVDASKLPRGAR